MQHCWQPALALSIILCLYVYLQYYCYTFPKVVSAEVPRVINFCGASEETARERENEHVVRQNAFLLAATGRILRLRSARQWQRGREERKGKLSEAESEAGHRELVTKDVGVSRGQPEE